MPEKYNWLVKVSARAENRTKKGRPQATPGLFKRIKQTDNSSADVCNSFTN